MTWEKLTSCTSSYQETSVLLQKEPLVDFSFYPLKYKSNEALAVPVIPLNYSIGWTQLQGQASFTSILNLVFITEAV